jgi:23S rRNA (guanine1835-N2)-methyltransferase
MTLFSVPGGELTLRRLPLREDDPLRAWDAADEYLISYLTQEMDDNGRVLILNDAFGALTLGLLERHPDLVTDSAVAQLALRHNAEINGLSVDHVTVYDPLGDWGTPPGAVVLKVPKTHALLSHQLHRLRALLPPSTPIVAAGMAKHIHTSTLNLFESIVGPTTTSLARKKARLIFATLDPTLAIAAPPDPITHQVPEYGLTLVDHPSVFSQGRLDRGTRLLLENLPSTAGRCVDLGCGNGALGIAIALAQRDSHVTFVDESHLAVASARAGWSANGLDPARATFQTVDCLADVEEKSVDLILCNPPFHQGQAKGDQIAWRMFTQARATLRPGGQLCVVGNRHLGYHVKLARLFGRCETLASDGKFVVLSVRRPE